MTEKSLGQIAFEASGLSNMAWEEKESHYQVGWHNAAQAIASAIRSHEPQDTLHTRVAVKCLASLVSNTDSMANSSRIANEEKLHPKVVIVSAAFDFADAFMAEFSKRNKS